jgi:biotin carboxylase
VSTPSPSPPSAPGERLSDETAKKVLDAAARAFERGDYRLVGVLTRQVRERSTDPATIEAATRLAARLMPGRGSRILLGLTLGLLLAVTAFAYGWWAP